MRLTYIKNKKDKTMKKMIITIGLFLVMSPIFAEGEKYTAITKSETTIELNTIQLQPITPTEATFEDVVIIDVKNLEPKTPKEATFEDAK
jgi:hypothetical protein